MGVYFLGALFTILSLVWNLLLSYLGSGPGLSTSITLINYLWNALGGVSQSPIICGAPSDVWHNHWFMFTYDIFVWISDVLGCFLFSMLVIPWCFYCTSCITLVTSVLNAGPVLYISGIDMIFLNISSIFLCDYV